MRVEQTDQLIQLILNSVVMMLTCVMVVGGWTTRHAATIDRLRLLQQEHLDRQDSPLTGFDRSSSHHVQQRRLSQFKANRLTLRRQYRLTQASVVTAVYALFCAVSSTLAIVCRALVDWNGLILIALVLFVAGLSLLLLSIGLVLVDIHLSSRSLWHEILKAELLKSNEVVTVKSSMRSPSRRMLQRFSSSQK
jgi:hypothetical protein